MRKSVTNEFEAFLRKEQREHFDEITSSNDVISQLLIEVSVEGNCLSVDVTSDDYECVMKELQKSSELAVVALNLFMDIVREEPSVITRYDMIRNADNFVRRLWEESDNEHRQNWMDATRNIRSAYIETKVVFNAQNGGNDVTIGTVITFLKSMLEDRTIKNSEFKKRIIQYAQGIDYINTNLPAALKSMLQRFTIPANADKMSVKVAFRKLEKLAQNID